MYYIKVTTEKYGKPTSQQTKHLYRFESKLILINQMANIRYKGQIITKGKSESGKTWYSVQVGYKPAFFTGQLKVAKKYVDVELAKRK